MKKYSAVLYDLDGTFLDTALDLGGALNDLRQQEGLPHLPISQIRPIASDGARGLLKLGFALEPQDPPFDGLRERYLALYQQRISRETRAFSGIDESIQQFAKSQFPWGIVTNKPGYLTQPLLEQLNYWQSTPCIVSGDTTAKAKPSPLPMYYACEILNIAPERCLYVGDAKRDIEAGQNAGMDTVIAKYGYIREDENLNKWQATYQIEKALDVLELLAL